MMERGVRVGVIGATRHAGAMPLQGHDRAKVVALCGRDQDRAAEEIAQAPAKMSELEEMVSSA